MAETKRHLTKLENQIRFIPFDDQWEAKKKLPYNFNLSDKLREKLDEILAEAEKVKQ